MQSNNNGNINHPTIPFQSKETKADGVGMARSKTIATKCAIPSGCAAFNIYGRQGIVTAFGAANITSGARALINFHAKRIKLS